MLAVSRTPQRQLAWATVLLHQHAPPLSESPAPLCSSAPVVKLHAGNSAPWMWFGNSGHASMMQHQVASSGASAFRGFAAQTLHGQQQQPAQERFGAAHVEHVQRKRAETSSDKVPVVPHPGLQKDLFLISSPAYTKEYMESIKPTHRPADTIHLKAGLLAVKILRTFMDTATGYGRGKMTEPKWLRRIIFLETVAGVPGMVAGMLRHMRSLRTMKRDQGWIHTLLEESENERMHLLTFMQLNSAPSLLLRAAVLLSQGVFFNIYLLAYLISPKTCHAFVGYLEEEAVKTYTHLLEEIDAGKLWSGKPAPQLAKTYWKLGDDATMRDLVLAVRADEASHGHVNHTFSDLKPDDTNPFGPPGLRDNMP